MGEIANCPNCHAIFLRGTATVCLDCRKQEEEDFQTVYRFIRQKKNRTATVEDITSVTGVSEDLIRKFVKERRLHPAQFPALAYSCEKCGASIQEDRLCSSCKNTLEEGLKAYDQTEQTIDQKKRENLSSGLTYYSVNSHKKS